MSAQQHYRLSELAERFKLEFRGDPNSLIDGVATLQNATSGKLSFLANPHYRNLMLVTHASAVILHPNESAQCPCACLISNNPYVSYAKVAALFSPSPTQAIGIHPSAVIEIGAQIDPSASIGALCFVAATARIDAGAQLGPACIIGSGCIVGAHSNLVARVTLEKRVRLGQRVLIHPGAVLGADGFGIAFDQSNWIKVPQLGGVFIGDDCEIGANTTIDCGAIEDTVLGPDVRLDNQIQIGHNVQIGAHTAIAGCAAIAGSAKIGSGCLIGGAVGIVGHIEIADRVTITAMSLVTHSIRDAGEYSSGTPLMSNKEWRKAAVRFKQLDQVARKKNSSL